MAVLGRGPAFAICAAFAVWVPGAAEPPSGERPFEVAAWVDHFDFGMSFDTETEAGLARILDHVAETGANVQCFRSSGNSIRHPSAFRRSYRAGIDKRKACIGDRVIFGWADFNRPEPDLLEAALRLGRERGMRPYIHWPFEECHAPGFFKAFMDWNMEHPEFWGRTHAGQPWLGRVSLCYPEVVDSKLAILDELLARGAAGIFIDTFRSGMWGPWAEYVPTVTAAYREKYGEDAPADPREPRWCEHVADYVTELLRRLREHLDAHERRTGRKVELLVGVAGIAPLREMAQDGPLLSRAADWRAWVDMGIIDTLVMHSVDWDPRRPFETYREYGRQVMEYVDGRCKVHWPASAYSFRRKGLKHLAEQTGLSQAEVAARLMTIAWEEGGAGLCMECVDHNNYRPETRHAIAELARTTCRTMRPWTPRGTAPTPENRRLRPRPAMAPRRAFVPQPVPELEFLPAGPGNNTEAAWSPDGTTIAFQSDRDGEARIHLLDTDTGAVRPLDTGPGCSQFPAWSPDGASLVYAYGFFPKTAFQAVADAHPGWNGGPLSAVDKALRQRLDGVNIWRLDLADGSRRPLTGGLAAEYLPTVTPDGQRVLFSSNWGADGPLLERENSMFVQGVALRGGDREALFRQSGAYAVQPTLSPDGRYVAFARLDSHDGIWHLVLARLDNPSFAVRLTPPTFAAYAPRWSPDGQTIACTGYRDGDPGWQLYLLCPRPGATPVRVETGLERARNPSWSPAGRWILFEARQDSRYTLSRLPVQALPIPPDRAADPEGIVGSRPVLSSDLGSTDLYRIFDRNPQSAWRIEGVNHWIEMHFGRPVDLAGFRLHHGMLAYWKNPSGAGSARGYRFQALLDGEWRDLITPVTDAPPYQGQDEEEFVAQHRFETARSQRFRFLVTDTHDTGKRVQSPDRVSVPPEQRSTYLRELELVAPDGTTLLW
ncbi:MAG: PD40 domain-containing protein [Lentisphaeria bacterium]|nr:PD40 domain-containing protein [Lentisphaeria bacterium]